MNEERIRKPSPAPVPQEPVDAAAHEQQIAAIMDVAVRAYESINDTAREVIDFLLMGEAINLAEELDMDPEKAEQQRRIALNTVRMFIEQRTKIRATYEVMLEALRRANLDKRRGKIVLQSLRPKEV